MNTISGCTVNIVSTESAWKKRTIVEAYCAGWISARFAQALIDALELRGA